MLQDIKILSKVLQQTKPTEPLEFLRLAAEIELNKCLSDREWQRIQEVKGYRLFACKCFYLALGAAERTVERWSHPDGYSRMPLRHKRRLTQAMEKLIEARQEQQAIAQDARKQA